MKSGVIEVDYRFPPGVDPRKQGEIIAVGQTAGSWEARYAPHREALSAHLGHVQATCELPEGHSLATVEFPLANVEGDIASLLTMVFGKYSMAGPAKIVDIRLPADYGVRPKLGLAGIRQQLQVEGRPLFMCIFKPSLGLTAAQHAAILAEAAPAGLDIIKDDEIMGDLPGAPTRERLRACREVMDHRAQTLGRPVLYAVNLTGRADKLLAKARELVKAGANALLLNVLSYGFSVLEALAADSSVPVPIFAHPSLAGALCGAPDHGLTYPVVLGTLAAHAGADAVLYPSSYGSLPFAAQDERTLARALLARGVAPVPSAGVHPGILPRALADYGIDVILNAGTGIVDHPGGAGAGVRAFFEAWERHRAGASFDPAEVPAGPLQQALKKWGGR